MGHSFANCQIPRDENSTDPEGGLNPNDHHIT